MPETIEGCQHATANAYWYIARSFSGVVGAVLGYHHPESYVLNNENSGAGYGRVTTFPNGPDNGLILSRKVLTEIPTCLRGVMPGAYVTPQNCHTFYSRNTIQDGSGDLAGRKLLAVKCGGPAGTSSQGVMFFDITGPWAY